MLLSYLSTFWRGLRQLTDDDAFDRYLERHTRLHPEVAPMGRQDFYNAELKRKWDGVRRCC